MTRHFAVLLTYDGDAPGFVVTVPSLPGCFTQGATVPEALDRAREAIAGHIAALADLGEPIPQGDAPTLLTVIGVDDLPLAGD